MTPQLIKFAWNFNDPKTLLRPFAFGTPSTSDLPLVEMSSVTLPRNALFAMAIQVVNTKFAQLAADGTAPSTTRKSLTDFTGTPVLVIQTETQIQENSSSFVAAFNSYMSIPWQSLANGCFAIGGALDKSIEQYPFNEDYKMQMWLTDAAGNVLRVPDRPIFVDIQADAGAGVTTGPAAAAIRYEGPFTITAGQPYVDIAIGGLTAATGKIASLQQQDNGNGLTQFVPTITDGNLRITPTSGIVANDWLGYYVLGNL